ncbi:unnamed protein product [Alopecurus aequalis]
MEAAIAWLVQTIVATLLIDKLDAWIRQVGLADDVEKLKYEVERVDVVIGDVRGRSAGNRLLDRLLARLKDLLYDADDVIDELDYYRLQQHVQGVTSGDPQDLPAAEQVDDTSRGNADMPHDDTSSSRGVNNRKRRSRAWENFSVIEVDQQGKAVRAACKHCHTPIKCAAKDGTSGMLNHNKVCHKKPRANDQPPNPSSAGDATETATHTVIADSSGGKRRREDEESAQITVANTYTSSDKAELSNRIQKITSQLQDARGEVSEILKLYGSDSASSSNHHPSIASDEHLKTSSLVRRQVYGRVAEKDSIKNLILEDRSDGVRVLPIVGIAGVGKTALAQFVYNDPEVESKFDSRIWVWVSRNFDEVRLTREMLDFVSQERHEGISGFAKLQEILKGHVNSKRLLLVFDDVWDGMKDCRWDKLLAPFVSGQSKGTVILVTTRNLSVAKRDQDGNIPRNEKFEENLRNAVTSVSKLRTLLLLGRYDSFFFQLFQDMFQKAGNLRLVQMSLSTHFNSFMCLANPAHLRYIRHKEGYSSIAGIGKMTSLQELNDFQVQMSSGFEITQLQSLNKLVQLGVSQLVSVKTREEAYGARLIFKVHLEKLHLSWNVKLSDSDSGSESSEDQGEDSGQSSEQSGGPSSESMDNGRASSDSMDTGKPSSQSVDNGRASSESMDNSRASSEFGGPSFESSIDTAKEVLEGLEPYVGLKHLQITGYNGTISPTWLAKNISITSLQTLHLDGCGGWRILPSLEILPFLTKLKLTSMPEVMEVLVPSLEELVLTKMPKLERCTSTSAEGLRSSLRALLIKKCPVLKEFDLFENNDGLSGLRKFHLHGCPHLEVPRPLPPSATCFELLIQRVSALPSMKVASSEKLCIGYLDEDEYWAVDDCSDELSELDDNILAFHNLKNLKSMRIMGCRNLTYISFKGFSHLVSLKSLEISVCEQLFSSDEMAEDIHEDVTAANGKAFPSLESLTISSCGITEKWLSLLLQHAPELRKLHLKEIPWRAKGDGLVQISLKPISSLKEITISKCPRLTFNWSEERFSEFTSIQEHDIGACPDLFSSLVHKDRNADRANGTYLLPTSLEKIGIHHDYLLKTLQPCFPSDLTNLEKLKVWGCVALESLQLSSCTALKELMLWHCDSLTSLEGLQSLGSLRHLEVFSCSDLSPCLESFSRQGYELFPRLERMDIDDPSVLTTSFCHHGTSLRCLRLRSLVLTEEQGEALVLLTALQELEFYKCSNLIDLPAGLETLHSLKRLIIFCCSAKLADQCRLLATSNLDVTIW